MTTLEIIKELCEKEGIKISTIEKEMGYGNGSLSKAKKIPADRILELSERFNVSMEYLMGKEHHCLKDKDIKDINLILANTEELLKQDGLMFDGNPANEESVESILSAMKIGMEMAKKKNKEKYTPKKYKEW